MIIEWAAACEAQGVWLPGGSGGPCSQTGSLSCADQLVCHAPVKRRQPSGK